MKETEDLKRWIIWGSIPFILLLIFFLFILTLPIGPGLPQHMDFSGAVIGNLEPLCPAGDDANNTGGSDFCISQKNFFNYPKFLSLSPMAGYAVFRKAGTNETFVAATWYFENQDECATSEKELYQYLRSRGQVAPVVLDLTQEIQSWKNTGRQITSPVLKGTTYEGNNTAGYFFVVKNAVMPGREDCFIEYLGHIGQSDFSADSADLQHIIAWEGNPWYLFTGRTGPMSDSSETR